MLMGLPYEVLYCEILWRLSARDLVSLSRVNREVNHIVRGSGLFEFEKHVIVGVVTIDIICKESIDMLRGVRVVVGTLIIVGDVGDAISRLEVVTESLVVYDASTTAAFASLTTVGGDLDLSACDIGNLTGLVSLTTVGRDLNFFGCKALLSTAGLESLSSVGRDLVFFGCVALYSLVGLASIRSVGGDVCFGDCPRIMGGDGYSWNDLGALLIRIKV